MSEKRDKFWMVWRENSPTTRYRHWSKQAAKREAERLSQQNPGEVFYVLKTTAAMITEPSPVKKVKLVEAYDQIPF